MFGFMKEKKIISKKEVEAKPKKVASEPQKKEKNPLKKYIGRVTNDGREVLAVFPKKDVTKAKSREFIELRLVDGVRMIVPLDEVEEYLKNKSKK